MKRMIAVVAVAAIAMVAQSANAQDYFGGYQFGAGIRAAAGGGCCGMQREQPPYFAKFPPVYYSHIVPRPYGISPYAAPAGIAPVEMSVPVVQPITKINPFFKPGVEPVETIEGEVENQITRWKSNVFFGNNVATK